MAIHTPKGYQISPIAMFCATLAFIATLACIVIFVLYGDADKIGDLVRPLIPTFTTIGAALVLYIKSKQAEQKNTEQNMAIAERSDTIATKADVLTEKADEAATKAAVVADKAGEAATKAAEVADQVGHSLNGDLDERIATAVATALAKRDYSDEPLTQENEDNSHG